MFKQILVACLGNICRSPLAAARLHQLAPTRRVVSAGIQAVSEAPAHAESQRIALKHDMDLSAHRAHQLTDAMCKDADLILVMEESHIEAVCHISPTARGKVMLLGRWNNNREIPDPYRKGTDHFESAYQLIDQFARQWQQKMQWQ